MPGKSPTDKRTHMHDAGTGVDRMLAQCTHAPRHTHIYARKHAHCTLTYIHAHIHTRTRTGAGTQTLTRPHTLTHSLSHIFGRLIRLLSPFRVLFMNTAWQQRFAHRKRTVEFLREHPEVMQIPIKKPIMITGMHRTGSTFLQRLMSVDPAARRYKIDIVVRCAVFNLRFS